MTAKKKNPQKKKNPHWGSTFDDFLEEEGVLEEFRAVAVKEVIAWQIQQAMKKKKLSKNKMAKLMDTSRAQLDRLLDPKHGTLPRCRCARARAAHPTCVSLERGRSARPMGAWRCQTLWV